MAEQYKAGYPLAPANSHYRSDEESPTTTFAELRCKKQKKWFLYGVAFVIFQTGIIVLFSLTVMEIRTPQYKVRSATFDDFNDQTTTPSFNLMMNVVLGVKNTNFGPYQYDTTAVNFFCKGTPVGSADIQNSKASFRSTKKINVVVNLINQAGNIELGNDLNSGILPLTSQSTLNGKVELMFIFKKKKAIKLDCTMDVNIATKELQNVQCN